jgi:Lon protease-like protein
VSSFLDVAIFPLPNQVSFPGTVVPLHVFEPRYRKMIDESVEHERMIAVCHVKKQIGPAKKPQSIQRALNTNQASYLPQEIFSAGPCNILKRSRDGRIYVNISMRHRLKFDREIQTLPYRIASCSLLHDDPVEPSQMVDQQIDIVDMILDLIGRQAPTEVSRFNREAWLTMDPQQFSFTIFQLLRFKPELMQFILELTNPEERLQLIVKTLTDNDHEFIG